MEISKLDISLTQEAEPHQKQTYSLNPHLNKRIKSKRIEDIRQQAVKNVKKSLSLIDSEAPRGGRPGFFG